LATISRFLSYAGSARHLVRRKASPDGRVFITF